MNSLARWIRTTFDYNPTFPLSALALLVGLQQLTGDGGLDAGVAETAVGLGILQGYELALLGVALAVLWPRKIAYETTAILIIFSVVRFAAPFLVIGLAADGALFPALAFGLGLWLLMTLKGEAIVRRVGLDLRGWERGLDVVCYGAATVLFPLLADRLAVWTGDAISHGTARLLQMGAWWALAVALAPLALGLDGLGRTGALRSRRPAIVWRALTAGGLVVLLFNATWLGGGEPVLAAVLPLVLVGTALFNRSCMAAGWRLNWAHHVPALTAGAMLLCPTSLLLGRVPVVSHELAILAFLPLAGAAVLLIAPGYVRPGLRSLAAVAAAAPLRFLGTWQGAELYLLLAALAVVAVGLVRRRDLLVAHGTLVVAGVGSHLLWQASGDPARVAEFLLVLGLLSAAATVWRLPRAEVQHALRVALGLCLVPAIVQVGRGDLDASTLGAILGASAGLGLLGWRLERRLFGQLALGLLGASFARRFGAQLDPGVALVLLAFAGIPAGTAIALRRERGRAEELPLEGLGTSRFEPDAAERAATAELAELDEEALELGPTDFEPTAEPVEFVETAA